MERAVFSGVRTDKGSTTVLEGNCLSPSLRGASRFSVKTFPWENILFYRTFYKSLLLVLPEGFRSTYKKMYCKCW